MFGGEFGLSHGISASQFIVRAPAPVPITEEIENRYATTEVLGGGRRIAPRHLQQSVQTLRLSRQEQVSRRIRYQLCQALKVLSGFFRRPAFQRGLGKQEA